MNPQRKSRKSSQLKQEEKLKKMDEQKPSESRPKVSKKGITRLTVAGFKSISQEQSIEIRPLTILAGANSSGKTSIMQPLLLLKQTLEANYDPGALLLNGPNVRFSSAEQLLSCIGNDNIVKGFHVGVEIENGITLTPYFTKGENKGFDIEQMGWEFNHEKRRFYLGMEVSELLPALPTYFKELFSQVEVALKEQLKRTADLELNLVVVRNRCFLAIGLSLKDFTTTIPTPFFFDSMVAEQIREMIHLPGLRGNPERTYPITAVSSSFPGTFENYFASVIGQWQVNDNKEKLGMLNRDLMRLGLTSNVVAQPVNDTQVELRINRLLRTNHDNVEDMVSIADVGLGVSQTLPVLVALHLADPGQLIFLEQPEIHLHPRAQFILAEVLADAALRGINLVVETHSSLLLLGIQTLVAEGKLPAEKIKLHWFDRPENGSTRITSADLDETGAFGNWPEDFAAVTLDAEGRFLDAQSKLAEI